MFPTTSASYDSFGPRLAHVFPPLFVLPPHCAGFHRRVDPACAAAIWTHLLLCKWLILERNSCVPWCGLRYSFRPSMQPFFLPFVVALATRQRTHAGSHNLFEGQCVFLPPLVTRLRSRGTHPGHLHRRSGCGDTVFFFVCVSICRPFRFGSLVPFPFRQFHFILASRPVHFSHPHVA